MVAAAAFPLLFRRCRHDTSILIDIHPLHRHLHLILLRHATGNRSPRLLVHLQFPALPPYLLQMLEVLVVHGRDVLPAEDADLEIRGPLVVGLAVAELRLPRGVCACEFQVGKALVHDAVGADMCGDGFGADEVVGDELGGAGEVDAVDVGVGDGGSAAGEVDGEGAGFAGHGDDFAGGGAADDAVVDEEDVAVFELVGHGVEFAADAALAGFLLRHDEGAEDVAVFHERVAVVFLEAGGDDRGGGGGGFGDGDHDVDAFED